MKQGYSGSVLRRTGNLVKKVSSDLIFINSKERQRDLIALSQSMDILPRIDRIKHSSIYMEYIDGQEGLTIRNALQAGKALRRLHNQRSYPYPCMTGLEWLIQIANENLEQINSKFRISSEIALKYPVDSLIHSEPVQFMEKKDGVIVFIDFEGIGMGSRYHDLGYIYYSAIKEDHPELFTAVLEGYQSEPFGIEIQRVKQLAGIISLAYARFAECEKRIQLGVNLFAEGSK